MYHNGTGGSGHGHMPSSTVVRSCTEFSHERSHSSHSSMSSSSPTVVSKLLIQPAHVKSQSMSRWLPSSNGRNPGVTLLHASEHVSIMPVRTIPAGRLKQLISSPHLPSHQSHLNSLPSSSISRQDGTGTSSSATMSMLPSPVSYASPHSASSPQGRTIRVAQPPPFMPSGVTTTSFPSCSSSSSSSHGPQQHLANSISVPTLHPPKHASDAPPSGPHQFSRNALSASALGERFSRMSYDELMELARNQQSQIETNEAELDERRKAVALFGVARRTAGSETEQQQNAKMLMANLRAQIQRDEQELAQLGQCQKEARQVQEHNQAQGHELGQLESEYGHYENQLRHSVQKVDSLRNQLEAMYQRRAAAADAAVARQRQLNGLVGTAVEAGRKMSAERRPKASVSPFKSGAARDEPDRASPVKKGLNSSCQPSSSFQPSSSCQSSASVQTVHWRKDFQQLPADVHHQNGNGSGFFHAPAPPPAAVDKISLRPNSINQAKRNSLISLTESGDEHLLAMLFSGEQRRGRNHISFGQSWEGQLAGMGGAGGGGLVANAKASLGFLNGGEKGVAAGRNNRGGWKEEEETEVTRKAEANVQQQKKQEELDQKQPSSIPIKSSPVKKAAMPYESGLDMFNKTFDQQQTRVEEKPGEEEEEEEVAKTESSEEEEEEEEKQKLEKQKLDLKQDKQKPEFKQDKKEEPKLTEERKKPDEQLEEEEEEEESEEEEEKPHLNMERKAAEEEAESSHNTETAMLDDIQLSLDANLQKFAHLEEEGDEPTADHAAVPGGSPTNSSSSAESVEKEEIQFDKSWHFQRPAGVVGILRRADKRKSSRRVQFDMVVLFLDVAYEGQFETLVELASKVEDISVANSEGITALHYAICASHEQIVHFLVDHGANVNALDVDGWSPLHCAASCNNLAMLRLLVENGACPFATTISKSETAAQIFYENNEYATGAEYMELVEECMGEVNDRKVYAAYTYEAEREDELGFEEGDELRVLRKAEREEEPREEEDEEDEAKEDEEHEQRGDEPIQLWWLCENTRNGQIGLVPRNYLALFPSWKHRGRYQITYKLPAQPEGEEKQDNGQSPSEKESKDGMEEDEDGQMEGLISSVGGNKPLGHQELSTYA